MLKRISAGLVCALLGAASLSAQMWPTKNEQLGATASGAPKVRNEWYIDSATIALAYSRPSLKGRPLDAVVAKDTPWRAGDDDAATLTSNKPLVFGNINVPAGTYSLWIIPTGPSWTLAINKATDAAAKTYAQAQDVGRIAMKTDKLPKPADLFSLTIEPSSDRVTGGVQLAFEFGEVRAVAPFVVRRS